MPADPSTVAFAIIHEGAQIPHVRACVKCHEAAEVHHDLAVHATRTGQPEPVCVDGKPHVYVTTTLCLSCLGAGGVSGVTPEYEQVCSRCEGSGLEGLL